MKAYGWSEDKAPRILNLGSTWKWAASCTLQLLYLYKKNLQSLAGTKTADL
jgi:hypothetical protein